MKREFLKKMGLTDEQIDDIMAEHGNTVNDLKANLKTVTTERDGLQTDIADRDKQLKTLQDSTGDVEKLKADIADLQTKNSEADKIRKQALADQKVEFGIEKALILAKAKNPVTVLPLLDKSLIKLDDNGTVVGLSEQLENIKKEQDYLFESTEQTPPPGDGGNPPNESKRPPVFSAGSTQKHNGDNPVDLKELGKQKALERHQKKEENK